MQNFSQIGKVPWPTLTQILQSMPLKFLLYPDPGLCYIMFHPRHGNQRKVKVPHRKCFEPPKKETERLREYKLVKNDNFSLPTFSRYMNFSAYAFLDDNLSVANKFLQQCLKSLKFKCYVLPSIFHFLFLTEICVGK